MPAIRRNQEKATGEAVDVTARRIGRLGSSRRFRISILGQCLSDQRRHFRAVEFDAAHDLRMRHRPDRHLQQEAIILEDAVMGDDLFGNGFRITDEQRTMLPARLIKMCPRRRRSP